MRIVGLLLTGGRSSRMGEPKALLRVGPDNFLRRLLRTLEAAGLDDIIVVAGTHDDEIRRNCEGALVSAGVKVVTNPRPDRGQLSSLLHGLEAAAPHHADAVVMALVDYPFVLASTIVALVAAFHTTRAPILRPTFEGRHGHPVLFASEVFDALRAAPPAEGARAVVHAAGDRVVDVAVDDPGVVMDIDTPEDYARALAAFERRPPGGE